MITLTLTILLALATQHLQLPSFPRSRVLCEATPFDLAQGLHVPVGDNAAGGRVSLCGLGL